MPCPHIFRFFLNPGIADLTGKASQFLTKQIIAQRVKLLDSDESRITPATLVTLILQVIIDLAAADQDTAHSTGISDLRYNFEKCPAAERLD